MRSVLTLVTAGALLSSGGFLVKASGSEQEARELNDAQVARAIEEGRRGKLSSAECTAVSRVDGGRDTALKVRIKGPANRIAEVASQRKDSKLRPEDFPQNLRIGIAVTVSPLADLTGSLRNPAVTLRGKEQTIKGSLLEARPFDPAKPDELARARDVVAIFFDLPKGSFDVVIAARGAEYVCSISGEVRAQIH